MAAELTDAERLVVNSVNQAKANGKWMIAVWSVNEESLLTQDIVTNEFPTHLFQNCKDGIFDFIQEQVPSRETRTLPPADLGIFEVEEAPKTTPIPGDLPPTAESLVQKALDFEGGGNEED